MHIMHGSAYHGKMSKQEHSFNVIPCFEVLFPQCAQRRASLSHSTLKSLHLSIFIFLCYVTAHTFAENAEPPGGCPANVTAENSYYVRIWVMVPFGYQYKFSKARVEPAVRKALDDAIRGNAFQSTGWNVTALLATTEFELNFNDTECDAEAAPTVVVDIRDSAVIDSCKADEEEGKREVNVIVGMTCDYASGRVENLAAHWNWTCIYPGTRTTTFDNKLPDSIYGTMTRPGITSIMSGNFFARLFNHFQWNTSRIIYSELNSHGSHVSFGLSTDCSTMVAGMTQQFRNTQGWNRYEYYEYFTRDVDSKIEMELDAVMTDIREHARVSVWCVGKKTMRRAMVKAHEMNMTNGSFAFLYMDFYNPNKTYSWTDVDDNEQDDTSQSLMEEDNASDEILNEAFRALHIISVHTPVTAEYQQFSDSVKSQLQEAGVDDDGEYVNIFVAHYYDAVLLYLYGLMRSLCGGDTDFYDGYAFTKRLWKTEFESLGRNITIGSSGDRLLDFSLFDFNPNTSVFEEALFYCGGNGTMITYKQIDWPWDEPPRNIPECGDFVCPTTVKTDKTIYYVVGACAGVISVFFAATAVLFRKMQKERQLRKKAWKVKWADIDWKIRGKRTRQNSTGSSSKVSANSITSSNMSLNSLGLPTKQIFAKIGMYKNQVVAVKECRCRGISLDRAELEELQELLSLDHIHICKFIGANDEPPNVCILTEYCPRGSLQDLVEDASNFQMDDVFKHSLITDVVHGMLFLHRSKFQYHGNLKSSNCLVDSRFVVKLTDFGLGKFRQEARRNSSDGHKYFESKLWLAPELLRENAQTVKPDDGSHQRADVYSFAIIVPEVVFRKGVFFTGENLSPREILQRVSSNEPGNPQLRPNLQDDDDVIMNSHLRDLVKKCWVDNPVDRPNFTDIFRIMKKIYKEKNLVDSLIDRLEQHTRNLEEKVEERTELYKWEKDRADALLYQMLPQAVADKLKKGTEVVPTAFESVTVFFSDIVGFTTISHKSSPIQVVNMLNDLYTMFDQIIDQFDVYKVETIGDAYMVVSGLPRTNGNLHACEIARMSLFLLESANSFVIRHMPGTRLQLRIGMHSGPVVAGVVGEKMPRYCLFGDTVNTASRMESNGKPCSIHVSPTTAKILEQFGTFHVRQREDKVFLKGLGTWTTWWLIEENATELDTDITQSLTNITQSPPRSPAPTGNHVSWENAREFQVSFPSPPASRRATRITLPRRTCVELPSPEPTADAARLNVKLAAVPHDNNRPQPRKCVQFDDATTTTGCDSGIDMEIDREGIPPRAETFRHRSCQQSVRL